jgi:hypothetical protein
MCESVVNMLLPLAGTTQKGTLESELIDALFKAALGPYNLAYSKTAAG